MADRLIFKALPSFSHTKCGEELCFGANQRCCQNSTVCCSPSDDVCCNGISIWFRSRGFILGINLLFLALLLLLICYWCTRKCQQSGHFRGGSYAPIDGINCENGVVEVSINQQCPPQDDSFEEVAAPSQPRTSAPSWRPRPQDGAYCFPVTGNTPPPSYDQAMHNSRPNSTS